MRMWDCWLIERAGMPSASTGGATSSRGMTTSGSTSTVHGQRVPGRVSVPSGALRDVAPMLAFVLRDADVLVRWSETELLALLPATDREGAARTAERLRDAAEGMAASVKAAHWVGDTAQDLLGRVGAR